MSFTIYKLYFDFWFYVKKLFDFSNIHYDSAKSTKIDNLLCYITTVELLCYLTGFDLEELKPQASLLHF